MCDFGLVMLIWQIRVSCRLNEAGIEEEGLFVQVIYQVNTCCQSVCLDEWMVDTWWMRGTHQRRRGDRPLFSAAGAAAGTPISSWPAAARP